MSSDLAFYDELLVEIKDRIRQGQTRAALSANAEMIVMYWDIGRMIHQRQKEKGWGAGVIPRLAVDLKNELPEVKGLSERNIGYMIRFAREYGTRPILQRLVAQILWGHNILLMEKVKDLPTRLWYMQQTIEQGWSRDTLTAMIKSKGQIRTYVKI